MSISIFENSETYFMGTNITITMGSVPLFLINMLHCSPSPQFGAEKQAREHSPCSIKCLEGVAQLWEQLPSSKICVWVKKSWDFKHKSEISRDRYNYRAGPKSRRKKQVYFRTSLCCVLKIFLMTPKSNR